MGQHGIPCDIKLVKICRNIKINLNRFGLRKYLNDQQFTKKAISQQHTFLRACPHHGGKTTAIDIEWRNYVSLTPYANHFSGTSFFIDLISDLRLVLFYSYGTVVAFKGIYYDHSTRCQCYRLHHFTANATHQWPHWEKGIHMLVESLHLRSALRCIQAITLLVCSIILLLFLDAIAGVHGLSLSLPESLVLLFNSYMLKVSVKSWKVIWGHMHDVVVSSSPSQVYLRWSSHWKSQWQKVSIVSSL